MPGIDSIVYELGESWSSAKDVVRGQPELVPAGIAVDEWIQEFVDSRGLVDICMSRARSVTDVALGLLARFFDASPLSPSEIDMFIYGGMVEFGEGGGRPFRLAHEVGLPEHAEIFWHFIGCATGISAVPLALDRLRSRGRRHALVLLQCILGDDNPEHPRVMAETVCGDGMMLLHVTTEPARWELVSSHVSSLPRFYAYGLTPEGTIDPFAVIKHGVRHIRAHLGEDGARQLAGLYPVYNGFAQWRRFAKALSIPVEIVDVDTLKNGGHIDSMDPLRGLADASSELEDGAKLLLYAQSLGMSFNTALFTLSG